MDKRKCKDNTKATTNVTTSFRPCTLLAPPNSVQKDFTVSRSDTAVVEHDVANGVSGLWVEDFFREGSAMAIEFGTDLVQGAGEDEEELVEVEEEGCKITRRKIN